MTKVFEHEAMQHAQQKTADDEEINLLEYWQVIRRRSRAILSLGFLAALIGTLVAFSLTPLYRAEIKLLVEPDAPKVVSVDPLQGVNNILFFYQTQYDIIGSRSIANNVIEELGLERQAAFINALPVLQDEPVSGFNAILKWLPASWELVKKSDKVSNEETRATVVEYFLENLSVKGQKNSQIINIAYESPDPTLSAQIANAISDAYIEKGLNAQFELNRKASGWLTERLADLRTKLELSEQTLRNYLNKEQLVDTKSFSSIASGKLSGITEALIQAQARRAEASIRYDQVKDAQITGRSLESLQAVLQNNFVQGLKEEQAKLARSVNELEERYGEKHPKMIAGRADLRETNRRLRQEVKKITGGIRRDYEAAVANETELKRLSQEIQKDARGEKTKEFKLAKLERDVETNRQLYEVLLTRYKETNLTGKSDVTNITIVDPATPPLEPSKPKKKLIIAVALMAGLILGLLLAFILDYLENTFRTPEDIENKLGLPILGVIPMLELEKNYSGSVERFAFDNPQSPFVEALNGVRTGIMFANIDEPAKIIMVTSSAANEGKTTLCSNLALTFSHTGKTLLIDGDLRKQQHSKNILQRNTAKGLAEMAAGKIDIKECILKDVDVGNLFYMNSGAESLKPLELLSSKRFAQLLTKLREHFDHIIIDSAPVLPVSDSLVLGNLVDEVVMVIRADETTHAMAQESVKRLASAHIVPLGVVLQQADLKKMEDYGSHYYTYGYGYENE